MILYTMDQYLVGFLVFAEIQKKKKNGKKNQKKIGNMKVKIFAIINKTPNLYLASV